MTYFILSCRISPLALLVDMKVALRVTPRKYRWLERVKKSCGIMAWVREVLHFPSAKDLHFLDSADLCIMHPEENSKRFITLSTSLNSHKFVIAGLRSSQ